MEAFPTTGPLHMLFLYPKEFFFHSLPAWLLFNPQISTQMTPPPKGLLWPPPPRQVSPSPHWAPCSSPQSSSSWPEIMLGCKHRAQGPTCYIILARCVRGTWQTPDRISERVNKQLNEWRAGIHTKKLGPLPLLVSADRQEAFPLYIKVWFDKVRARRGLGTGSQGPCMAAGKEHPIFSIQWKGKRQKHKPQFCFSWDCTLENGVHLSSLLFWKRENWGEG